MKSMGFNQADRMALLKLLMTDEKKLDNLTIQDWFKETPHMFETNYQFVFWYGRPRLPSRSGVLMNSAVI